MFRGLKVFTTSCPKGDDSVKDNSAERRLGLVVFLQSYSLLRILFLVGWLRRAKEILFACPVPKQGGSKLKRKFILRWLRLLNAEAEICQVTMAEMVPDYYSFNEKSAKVADLLGPEIKRSTAYRTLFSIVGDEAVLLFYKAYLAREIPHSLLYVKMAKGLIRDGREVVLSPDTITGFGEGIHSEVREELYLHTPASIRLANRIAVSTDGMRWKLLLLFLPAVLFLRHLRNGPVRSPKKRYHVAIPVVWGVFKDSEAKMSEGVLRFSDDMYLYGRHFFAGRGPPHIRRLEVSIRDPARI